MFSAFQCREYGFQYSKFDEINEAVNAYRTSQRYLDGDAAKYVLKIDGKSDCEEDPFIRLFQ